MAEKQVPEQESTTTYESMKNKTTTPKKRVRNDKPTSAPRKGTMRTSIMTMDRAPTSEAQQNASLERLAEFAIVLDNHAKDIKKIIKSYADHKGGKRIDPDQLYLTVCNTRDISAQIKQAVSEDVVGQELLNLKSLFQEAQGMDAPSPYGHGHGHGHGHQQQETGLIPNTHNAALNTMVHIKTETDIQESEITKKKNIAAAHDPENPADTQEPVGDQTKQPTATSKATTTIAPTQKPKDNTKKASTQVPKNVSGTAVSKQEVSQNNTKTPKDKVKAAPIASAASIIHSTIKSKDHQIKASTETASKTFTQPTSLLPSRSISPYMPYSDRDLLESDDDLTETGHGKTCTKSQRMIAEEALASNIITKTPTTQAAKDNKNNPNQKSTEAAKPHQKPAPPQQKRKNDQEKQDKQSPPKKAKIDATPIPKPVTVTITTPASRKRTQTKPQTFSSAGKAGGESKKSSTKSQTSSSAERKPRSPARVGCEAEFSSDSSDSD